MGRERTKRRDADARRLLAPRISRRSPLARARPWAAPSLGPVAAVRASAASARSARPWHRRSRRRCAGSRTRASTASGTARASCDFKIATGSFTSSAMSGTWVMGILVPSAVISMWCLLWCCFGAARHPPGSPARGSRRHRKKVTFRYNPVDTQSPRADPTPPASLSPTTPPSPPIVIVDDHHQAAPRTLPGLHFIHSTSIQHG